MIYLLQLAPAQNYGSLQITLKHNFEVLTSEGINLCRTQGLTFYTLEMTEVLEPIHPAWKELLKFADHSAAHLDVYYSQRTPGCPALQVREVVKKSKWKFLMAFAIRGPTPPPLNGKNFQTFFYPTFFLLQLNPTYMKLILHLVSVKNITFKSSYNWFKYWHTSAAPAADCQLLVCLAMFMSKSVHSVQKCPKLS